MRPIVARCLEEAQQLLGAHSCQVPLSGYQLQMAGLPDPRRKAPAETRSPKPKSVPGYLGSGHQALHCQRHRPTRSGALMRIPSNRALVASTKYLAIWVDACSTASLIRPFKISVFTRTSRVSAASSTRSLARLISLRSTFSESDSSPDHRHHLHPIHQAALVS